MITRGVDYIPDVQCGDRMTVNPETPAKVLFLYTPQAQCRVSMKRLLLLIWLLCLGSVVDAAPAYYVPVTVTYTSCGASQITNWAMVTIQTQTYLKTVANGGDVQNVNGYDIIPWGTLTGSTLSNQLNWEVEYYSATAGTWIAWIETTCAVTSGTQTVIYVSLDDPTITTQQNTPFATWDTHFAGVYHFAAGTSVSLVDSTVNARNGVAIGGPAAITGQIDGGIGFNGTSQGVNLGDGTFNVAMSGASGITLEAWAYFNSFNGSAGIIILFYQSGTAVGGKFIFSVGSTVQIGGRSTSTDAFQFLNAASGIGTGTWAYVVGVLDFGPGGGSITIYVNGAVSASGSATFGSSTYVPGSPTAGFFDAAGASQNAGGSLTNYLNGEMDELRLSAAVRSSSYITASYNNQSSPTTFPSWGSLTALSSCPLAPSLTLLGVGNCAGDLFEWLTDRGRWVWNRLSPFAHQPPVQASIGRSLPEWRRELARRPASRRLTRS